MATEAPVLTGTAPSGGAAVGAPTESTSSTPDAVLTDTSAELETPETAEPEAGDSEAGAEAAGETSTEDARLLPAHIKALKETNPALYKAEKARFFEHRLYRETFPTVAAAKQAAELLEQIGGEEGWAETQEFQATQDALNKQYTSSDPEQRREFARGLFKDNPQAARTMAPLFLEEFHRNAPQDYSRVMSRIVSNTFNMAFENLGVKRVLAMAKQKIQAAGATVPEEIAALEGWVAKFEEIANARSGMDEEREAFEREKQEFTTKAQREENTRLTNEYHRNARNDSQKAVRAHLNATLKGQMPEADLLPDLIEQIERRVAEMAGKDETFIRQRNQILARKDTERARKFVLAKVNQLLPEAAKRVMRLYNLGKRPVSAPRPSGSAAPAPVPAGITRLAKMPAPSDIDYRRSQGLIMRGEAILKNGKHVKWE
jgi:hypothetical protein